MIKLLNLEQAKNYAEKNIYEADLFISPLNEAIKRGIVIPISQEYFAAKTTEAFGCVWEITSIEQVSEEELQKYDLYCKYRYRAVAVEIPEGYEGVTEICAGIPIYNIA